MPPDSRDLAARVMRDPGGALVALTEKYGQALFDYARAAVGDDDVAYDATAGSLLAATRQVSDVTDALAFDVWLFSLARTECLLTLQLATERHRARSAAAAQVSIEAVPDVPAGNGEVAPDVSLVSTGFAALRAGDREVLALQRGQAFDDHQVAQIMGVTRTNAAARLARAAEHLREAVDAQVLLHDPPGSCDALDDMLQSAGGADETGLRRLISAHIADCPGCAERVADVRPVYAHAEAGPAAFRSGTEALAGVRQRLAEALPEAGDPAAGEGRTAPEPAQAESDEPRKRRWWLPA